MFEKSISYAIDWRPIAAVCVCWSRLWALQKCITDQGAIWGVDSGRPKESCIWWAHYPDPPPKEAAVLWVILGHAQICKQFIFSTLFARGQEQYHLGLPVFSSSLLISVRFIPVHFLPVQLLPLPLTHAHPFNGSFSGTTLVSRYQKGKTNLDFSEAR